MITAQKALEKDFRGKWLVCVWKILSQGFEFL